MTQGPNDPGWLSWVAPVAAAVTVMVAFFRRFFSTVTREDLRQTIEDMDKPQERRHQENLAKFDEIFDRVGKMGERLSRMEGQLSGRYPTIPEKRDP